MKAANHPLQKHTMNFYEGDVEELKRLIPDAEPSVIIRELLRNCIETLKAKEPKPIGLDVEIKL